MKVADFPRFPFAAPPNPGAQTPIRDVRKQGRMPSFGTRGRLGVEIIGFCRFLSYLTRHERDASRFGDSITVDGASLGDSRALYEPVALQLREPH